MAVLCWYGPSLKEPLEFCLPARYSRARAVAFLVASSILTSCLPSCACRDEASRKKEVESKTTVRMRIPSQRRSGSERSDGRTGISNAQQEIFNVKGRKAGSFFIEHFLLSIRYSCVSLTSASALERRCRRLGRGRC